MKIDPSFNDVEYYYHDYTYTKPSLTRKNQIIDDFEGLINSLQKWINGIRSRQFSGTIAIIGVSLHI